MDMDTIAVILGGIGLILCMFLVASTNKLQEYCYENNCKGSFAIWLKCIKEMLLKPICYFFGGQCPVCKKTYLSKRKAYMCCKNRPQRITFNPTSGNFGAGRKICTWCNGTGKKNGVGCDWCGGSGRLP